MKQRPQRAQPAKCEQGTEENAAVTAEQNRKVTIREDWVESCCHIVREGRDLPSVPDPEFRLNIRIIWRRVDPPTIDRGKTRHQPPFAERFGQLANPWLFAGRRWREPEIRRSIQNDDAM